MRNWYMEGYSPNACGGYETDAINEYATSNFSDLLSTAYSDSVLLYTSDLSESKEIKCVIQGNTADTQLKSIERTILAPIGTLKAGQYLFFENRYWIIDGYPGNNKAYEKATAKLCQYNLRWQLSDGEICDRLVNVTSASKYDVGEDGNNTIVLSSNTYTMLIGYDEKAMQLEGQRVFIDKAKIAPKKVFKLTRSDDVLYDYGDEEHGSLLSFIADKTEFFELKDNQELRICDYFSPDDEKSPDDETGILSGISANIDGNNALKLGRKRTYSVSFMDGERNIVDNITFNWNIVSDFPVTQKVTDKGIELLVDDEDCIGSSFLLQVIVNSEVVSEETINITGGY